MSNNFGKQTMAAILSKSISNTYKIAIFYIPNLNLWTMTLKGFNLSFNAKTRNLKFSLKLRIFFNIVCSLKSD